MSYPPGTTSYQPAQRPSLVVRVKEEASTSSLHNSNTQSSPVTAATTTALVPQAHPTASLVPQTPQTPIPPSLLRAPYSTSTTPINLQQYAQYLQSIPGMSNYPGFAGYPMLTPPAGPIRMIRGEEDEEEVYPGMDDADYSAQLQYQSQSKADLKVLLDHFAPEQHTRFEAYRRSALNKNSVRKVIQNLTGQQVSQPVAQVVAGIAKVFVGEIVEKAREVQERQGGKGALTPDRLREAYRMYEDEYGWIGPAKPLKAKRLFVR